MYVCICRGVTEKQIRQVAQQRRCSMQDLSATMGVGADCGHCTEYAHQLLVDIGNQSGMSQCVNAAVK